ncbi:MAG TPA: HAMP domain-containing sensor histidine kinase [Bacillaceae bacterium]|nr:HAMP domain-containing sensor histidine kinase [Paenibacillus bovis]HLU22414.1 HAMP domain-containing sensor histidine kinase [Bacillaceae bacterium]
MHSKTNLFQSFRFKVLLLFALSLAIAGTITFIIFSALRYYYRSTVQLGDPLAYVRYYIGIFGDVNAFLIIFIPLAIFIFFMLTKPYSIYFRKISEGIQQLASGNFSHEVQISAKDEFAHIAHDINLASQKLEEAVQRGDFSESSKDQLVVNLAHDLRTPLTSILGYLDLILKDGDLTKEQVRHYLSISYTKSQRLEKLIDELFEITRMNYGMLPLRKRNIQLTDLLHQLIEELYPIFEKNNLQVRTNLSSSLPINADGELLARVFENLLSNASRYGSDGEFIDINGFMDEGDIVIQIINYGSHIPAEELPHLFDMFFTGDKSRTQQGNSTGLGLFIAKNIIEQHNGTISVESDVIHTMFTVSLPQE